MIFSPARLRYLVLAPQTRLFKIQTATGPSRLHDNLDFGRSGHKDDSNQRVPEFASHEQLQYKTGHSILADFAFNMFSPNLLKLPDLNVPEKRIVDILYKLEGYHSEQLTRPMLSSIGLFGAMIPPEYGGLGLSSSEFAYLLSIPSLQPHSLKLLAHSALCGQTLVHYGSPEQKQKYLPRLASGQSIGAFCLSEASSGCDMFSMETVGVKNTKEDEFLVTGQKTWVTNGTVADLLVLFVLTLDSRHEGATNRITALLVDRQTAGISVGGDYDIGCFHQTAHLADISFDGVRVGVDRVLFEENGGYKIANFIQNRARVFAASIVTGACRQLVEAELANPLPQHSSAEGRHLLEKCSSSLYGMESCLTFTTRFTDSGAETELESAAAKMYCGRQAESVLSNHSRLLHLSGRSARYNSNHVNQRQLNTTLAPLLGSHYFVSLYLGGTMLNLTRLDFERIQSRMRSPVTNAGWLREHLATSPGNRPGTALAVNKLRWSRPLDDAEAAAAATTARFLGPTAQLFGKLSRVRLHIIDCLRNLREDARECQYLMSLSGDITAALYAASCSAARANTTHGDYESACTQQILAQTETEMERILQLMERVVLNTNLPLEKILAEDVRLAGGYAARDMLLLRPISTDNSA